MALLARNQKFDRVIHPPNSTIVQSPEFPILINIIQRQKKRKNNDDDNINGIPFLIILFIKTI